MFKTKKITVTTVTTLGALIAIEVILSRFFSIQSWNIRIGFGFIPIVIGALLYGPLGGALVAGIADVIGAILFPVGTFFPGFTLTACLVGLIYGFFLKKNPTTLHILFAVFVNQTFCSLLLNTYWISFTSGASFRALLYTRMIQYVVLVIVQIIVIQVLVGLVMPRIKGVLTNV